VVGIDVDQNTRLFTVIDTRDGNERAGITITAASHVDLGA
jgi:hypothetical protein